MTPNELARMFNTFTFRALANQNFFADIDKTHYHVGPTIGNAEYVASQAVDYLHSEKLADRHKGDAAYKAHVRSDISRIVALLHRQSLLHGFDFVELLNEGIEYETSVVLDIKEGRRPARSHKGLNAKSEAELERETWAAVKGPGERLEEMSA